MVVFIAGATGFIGSRLARAFAAAGHEVVAAVREPSRVRGVRTVAADFARDVDAAAWRPRLAGVDVVVNAVGILRERGAQTFAALHRDAPVALFSAAKDAGVARIVQISALGADAQATSRYHLSKRAADDYLATLPVPHAIVQPSLVFGSGGASARLFLGLASLPLIPLPGDGAQRVQPVHVDDLVACVVALAASRASGRVPVVGPRPCTLREMLGDLRAALGLRAARFVRVPMAAVRFAARAGDLLPSALLDRETLAMLERGNVAGTGATRAILGRAPRAVRAFVAPDDAAAARARAKLDWLLPVLRLSIAAVWIATGIVSLGIYPVEESYALLGRTGVPPALQPAMLVGASLLDLALGVATLALRRRRALWAAQVALIAVYTALISARLPEFWLHPYGPLLKNLPMLAAIALLWALEDEPREEAAP